MRVVLNSHFKFDRFIPANSFFCTVYFENVIFLISS